jgi:two-component system KDP operon response regulator KdpE
LSEDAPAHSPLVLVVDDEKPIRRFLNAALHGNGYRTVEAERGEEALREAATRTPDIVLLDLGLPDVDGIEVTRRLREWSTVPIVVLSARGQEQDKIAALDAGADDYVTKPFAVGELMARMRVALRHRAAMAGAKEETVLEAGPLRVDLARREVAIDGREVRLTPIEYKLLTALARHRGLVLTHEQLLREVWGPHARQRHYLRVYMAQLRHKLEPEPSRPRILITEPGVGYRLRDVEGP